MIKYIEGDLFGPVKATKDKFIILPHVCNDQNAWGAGFVVPLRKHFPEAEVRYRQMSLILGTVGTVLAGDLSGNVMICNMIAQTLGGKRPLFYNHLARCMDQVAEVVKHAQTYQRLPVEIHAPAFGSALAGGDWYVISQLIEDCWLRVNPVPVNIYYLPGTFLPPEQADDTRMGERVREVSQDQ